MAKTYSMILGAVLLLVGIAGYVTGGPALFGFGLNSTHNLVHVLSGIVGLLAGFGGVKYARWYCLGFGAIYGLVTIAGFLNVAQVVDLLNLNMADNVLHLVIAATALGVGYTTKA